MKALVTTPRLREAITLRILIFKKEKKKDTYLSWIKIRIPRRLCLQDTGCAGRTSNLLRNHFGQPRIKGPRASTQNMPPSARVGACVLYVECGSIGKLQAFRSEPVRSLTRRERWLSNVSINGRVCTGRYWFFLVSWAITNWVMTTVVHVSHRYNARLKKIPLTIEEILCVFRGCWFLLYVPLYLEKLIACFIRLLTLASKRWGGASRFLLLSLVFYLFFSFGKRAYGSLSKQTKQFTEINMNR